MMSQRRCERSGRARAAVPRRANVTAAAYVQRRPHRSTPRHRFAEAPLCHTLAVVQEVTVEELEVAMAAAVDEDGNDIRLAAWVASMTDEERRQSKEDLRRSLA